MLNNFSITNGHRIFEIMVAEDAMLIPQTKFGDKIYVMEPDLPGILKEKYENQND